MDRQALLDAVREGMTLLMYGRSGGVAQWSTVGVYQREDAERELAYWHRRWPIVSVVLMDGGVRVGSWGSA